MSKSIFVLHERSTKEHFVALESYANENELTIKYREFQIGRFIIKSILRLDFTLFVQQLKNVFFFLGMLFTKDKCIVIGIAPLNSSLLLLKLFLKNHHLFLFTSWMEWSGNRFPRNNDSTSSRLRNSWRKFLEQDIKGVFAITQSSGANLSQNYKLDVPISIVGHSIDNSIPVKTRKRESVSNGITQLIFVGRLVETKGVSDMIQLMNLLDPQKYHLKIVGDGPLSKEVESESSKRTNIEYLGFIKDKARLYQLYSESDFQLLFSKRSKINFWEELFGMVIIEAMYCGVPTIATDHVGPRSIIKNGVNGFLVEEENLIEETLQILKDNLNRIEKIGTESKSTAQRFYKKNLSKEWAKILDRFILDP